MNKTAIKNFAVWARRKLIADITYKAGLIGITETGIADQLPQSTTDMQFFDIGTKNYAEVSGKEIEQRKALVSAIKAKERDTDYKTAFQNVVEEVAYTWFNRMIAVRFMEVNDYLPSRIRVLSSENSAKLEPDFVTTPFDTDLDFTPYEKDRILQLKDENKLDELFRMLFIKQCNKLGETLPELFEKTSDYTELLLTISFTDKDGVVYHLAHDISEDDFDVSKEGQVEIIGWMYQYYNTDVKDSIDRVQGTKKIPKELIPAATQLFTPDWIVRYMVENSLGQLWVEGHENKSLKDNWKYYLDESKREIKKESQISLNREKYKTIKPEDIKLIDPCMGSGHILVYAFDVLMQIYTSQGYIERDAAKSIVENNLYGLDIDIRAYQLAYFAVMMKARQYNRRILNLEIKPNLFAIDDSTVLNDEIIEFISNDNTTLKKDLQSIRNDLANAKEYGSIIDVTPVDFDAILSRIAEIKSEDYEDILSQNNQIITIKSVLPIIKQAQVMSQKYDVVVTNPPYMGARLLNDTLRTFLNEKYPNEKTDTFSAFIMKCINMKKNLGFVGLMTPNTWLTINTYQKLREYIINNSLLNNMLLLSSEAFSGAGVVINSFILGKTDNNSTCFCNLQEYNEQQLTSMFEKIKYPNCTYRDCKVFSQLPNTLIDPSFTEKVIEVISDNKNIYTVMKSDGQTKTGNNDKFLRMLWEIDLLKIGEGKRWCLHAKGGGYRKWYGNVDTVIDWSEDARDFYKKNHVARITPEYLWYREGITWSLISGQHNSFRFLPKGYTFNCAAPTVFFEDTNTELYTLALLNSSFSQMLLSKYNTTVNLTIDDIGSIPYYSDSKNIIRVNNITNQNISISRTDWDSFETSWNFKEHPLVKWTKELWDCTAISTTISKFYGENKSKEVTGSLELCYLLWQGECHDRFNTLKANEEELNSIFIDIYGLQDELTPEVEDKDITVRKADKTRDIKSLISYAVGCMFGRYSLDVYGLAYAGGEWDESKYKSYIPDNDNCIPITDEEYFEDDIVGRFVLFIKTVYGEETLEENLNFIASALSNKGNTSREIIRNYFLNDFIKDHNKIYQKRPIYWMFDSGKQNGFKALVYMHRWNADTVGNVRVEYLHRIQRVYEKEIIRMQESIDNSTNGREIADAEKRKEKLTKQLKETKDYDTKIAHIALSRIDIDLDDGVKVNYEKIQAGQDGKKIEILAKI